MRAKGTDGAKVGGWWLGERKGRRKKERKEGRKKAHTNKNLFTSRTTNNGHKKNKQPWQQPTTYLYLATVIETSCKVNALKCCKPRDP